MLARQLVKDNMRSGAAKRLSAAHKGATSEDALLLAMYNDMQSKVRPAPPAPWATVDAAITALKAAGKIDDEDVPLFRTDARKALGLAVGAEPKAGRPLKDVIAEERPEVEAKFGEHVLLGGTRTDGRPAGYHSINGGSTTHEAFGAPTMIGALGAYQRSVRFTDELENVKETQSTFFPDAASKDQVLDALTSVYGATGKAARRTTVNYPVTLNGLVLEKISETTAFPAGGGKLTGEGYKKTYKPRKR